MGLFTRFIYQPFLNFLVGIYFVLDFATGGRADMGIAVILFTIALRILLLPLTLTSERTEKERKDIEENGRKIRNMFKNDPERQKRELRKLFKGNRRVLISEGANLTVQISIILMLYRLFATGLRGADLHLIYDFMPKLTKPFNLVFLERFDLTRPNLTLNLLQSLAIFIAEALSMLISPFPVTRKDIVRLQVILPITSFIIFAYLPAGKKLFIITTLSFSIVYMIVRHGLRVTHRIQAKFATIGVQEETAKVKPQAKPEENEGKQDKLEDNEKIKETE